jgi:CRISPR/Cas system CMR subunit Cmr4 (Cas7 group RAMP superfamily)
MQTDRLWIEYDLTFATPFHFGTGIREGLIDRTVIRDDGGYLYVPGSTLKGVLRERCEQLARFYDDASGSERVRSPHEAEAALLGLGNGNPPMVTRIFGSQNRPGQVFFDDARQDDPQIAEYNSQIPSEHGGHGKYKALQVDVSTQVRMDRPTRTAVPGALYTSEYGTNDLVFKGIIQGWLECKAIDTDQHDVQHTEIMPTYSLLLLLAGLRMVDQLGGNKSSGKGRCVCRITEMKVNESWVTMATLETWLEQLDALAKYGGEEA